MPPQQLHKQKKKNQGLWVNYFGLWARCLKDASEEEKYATGCLSWQNTLTSAAAAAASWGGWKTPSDAHRLLTSEWGAEDKLLPHRRRPAAEGGAVCQQSDEEKIITS